MWWNGVTASLLYDDLTGLFAQINGQGGSYGFSDWRLPDDGDINTLFAGWSGASPNLWLNILTGFNAFGVSGIWTSTPGHPIAPFFTPFQRVFNPTDGEWVAGYVYSHTVQPDSRYSVLPVRAVMPGESYFYPPNP